MTATSETGTSRVRRWVSTLLHETVLPAPGPGRLLCGANLVRTLGSGLLLATSTLYFSRVVGLSPSRVGTGFAVAAVAGLLVAMPAGRLADRFGPKPMTVAFTVLQGAVVALYGLISHFWVFVAMVSLVIALESATRSARSALIGEVVASADRVRVRSQMRAVSNIGVSVGAAVGGGVLYVDSAWIYRVVYVICGVLLVGSAWFYQRIVSHHQRQAQRPADAPQEVTVRDVFRDRPYVALSLLNGVLSFHDAILSLALPLWISTRTDAPTWVFSVIVLVNTISAILLQVRVGRSSDTVAGASRSLTSSGLYLGLSCLIIAFASQVSTWLTLLVLVLGAAAHVMGELQQSAAAWSLSYELAPEHAHGAYQGMFGMGLQGASIVTPLVAGTVLVAGGFWGWIGVGVFLAGAGLLVPRVTAAALRRQAQLSPPPTAVPVADV